MRVLFFDPLNTQNNFYVYAKYLREKSLDAHVILGTDSLVPAGHNPKWHSSNGGAEDWVHSVPLPYFMPHSDPAGYISRMKQVVNTVKKFDIVACSGLAPVWVSWSGVPFIFFSYGSDLDQMAVQGWSGNSNQRFSTSKKLSNLLVKQVVVWSLRKARATVLAPYQIDTAKRLGLRNIRFLPHIIDTNLFKPMSYATREQARRELREKLECDTVLFHPPRHAWTDKSLADCKGNDKVLRAFALFVKAHPDSKLIVVNKGWDTDNSRRLTTELRIADKVVWIEPINKTEMVKLYNTVDVVLDQFIHGVLTLVAIEAMACGTPAVTYVTQAPEGMFYQEMPPIKNTGTVEGIRESLTSIVEDDGLRKHLGEAGHEWVNRNCSPDTATKPYIGIFEEFCR